MKWEWSGGRWCAQATERTVWAVPEVSIGSVPDVGSHFHLRRRGHVGRLHLHLHLHLHLDLHLHLHLDLDLHLHLHLHLHRMLALTGLRVKGREVAGLGLASHYCSSSLLPSLRREVEECGVGEVGEVLEHFTKESGGRGEEEVAGMVEAWREVSVAGDLAATLGRSEEVLPKQAALLAAAAPLSLAVADRLLGQAEEESYAQALLTAYTVAGNIYFLPEMIKGAGLERVWGVGEGWRGCGVWGRVGEGDLQ